MSSHAGQLAIDFDPAGTAARLAAEARRDSAYADLVATVVTTENGAKEHGLWLSADEDGRVRVLVCPACGQYEVNDFLIGTNHGIAHHYLERLADGTWQTRGRQYGRNWCVALDLTSTHVAGGYPLSERQTRMLGRLRPDVRARFYQEVAQMRQRIAERHERQETTGR